MSPVEFQRLAIGVPFVEHGRGFDGWDCYGLLVAAFRCVLGQELPDFRYDSAYEYRNVARIFVQDIKPEWRPLGSVIPMTAACIYRRGLPIHAGLVVSKRDIMHVEQGVETCIEPIKSFRIEGFYAPNFNTPSVQN